MWQAEEGFRIKKINGYQMPSDAEMEEKVQKHYCTAID